MIKTGTSYDVVVVGGGPGGYAAALYGAAAGLSVAVVEIAKVGGTCLHRGCVPAKEFLETASVYRTVKESSQFGVNSEAPTLDFSVSQGRKQKVVDQLWKGLAGLMKRRKITVIQGRGRLLAGQKVKMEDGTVLQGRHVILATGSVPRTIAGFEIDGRVVLTSDEVLDLKELPSSAVVVGGGAIGCEFASMLADLGTKVTLLEAMPALLPGCDADVVDVLARSFKRKGIDVHTGVTVQGHDPGDGHTTVHFGKDESVTVEAVVISVGRRPYSDDLVDSASGVEIDERGYVVVDPQMRTTASNVWAIGDLVATPQLAHVGFAEAIVAIKGILNENAIPVDYAALPWCIYTQPEVAFAGYSEQQARDAGYDVVVKKDPFGGNSRARITGETDGMVKVIAERLEDGTGGRILGVHMVGPWVTEQLGQAYLAVNWEATAAEVAHFIQPHPTLSETFGETVMALTGRGLHVG